METTFSIQTELFFDLLLSQPVKATIFQCIPVAKGAWGGRGALVVMFRQKLIEIKGALFGAVLVDLSANCPYFWRRSQPRVLEQLSPAGTEAGSAGLLAENVFDEGHELLFAESAVFVQVHVLHDLFDNFLVVLIIADIFEHVLDKIGELFVFEEACLFLIIDGKYFIAVFIQKLLGHLLSLELLHQLFLLFLVERGCVGKEVFVTE